MDNIGKIAFVFSGQGAQKAGMGESFYNNFTEVKEVFDKCNEYRENTINQCFNGSSEELKKTSNTQPCLYLADLGGAIALKKNGIYPDGVAGFSLGEIPALAFAGAYSYIDGFKIVCKRGEYMQLASEEFPATMVAVLKLENNIIEETCKKYKNVFPVNYNAPLQLVVAGDVTEIKEFQKEIKSLGGRCMPIGVGGGFHSPFLNSASEKFREELNSFEFNDLEIQVYSNYTGLPYNGDYKELLSKQMNNPLLWQQTIEKMNEDGFNTFIEVGCGDTLKKLIKKILPNSNVYSVSTIEDLEEIKSFVKK